MIGLFVGCLVWACLAVWIYAALKAVSCMVGVFAFCLGVFLVAVWICGVAIQH